MGSLVRMFAKVLVALLLVVEICPRILREDQTKFAYYKDSREGRQSIPESRRRGAVNYKALKQGTSPSVNKKKKEEVKERPVVVRGEVGSTFVLYEILREDGTVTFVPIIPPGSAV